MREAYVGFDSAWAGKKPGGIVWTSFEFGEFNCCTTPRLTSFDDAATLIQKLDGIHDYVLVAMDQPTVVPNTEGLRPVERVAGSLLGKLNSGVQSTNRSKPPFNDDAPVWRFLSQISARECPLAARNGESGLHVTFQWRRSVRDHLAVIGDVQQGYMVTPVIEETKAILKREADKIAVPFNEYFPVDESNT